MPEPGQAGSVAGSRFPGCGPEPGDSGSDETWDSGTWEVFWISGHGLFGRGRVSFENVHWSVFVSGSGVEGPEMEQPGLEPGLEPGSGQDIEEEDPEPIQTFR